MAKLCLHTKLNSNRSLRLGCGDCPHTTNIIPKQFFIKLRGSQNSHIRKIFMHHVATYMRETKNIIVILTTSKYFKNQNFNCLLLNALNSLYVSWNL